ncbi:MAG: hypothetical protein FWF90_05025 [Promicromonosporaceae bacterium]|nr:hypothetical protein [Promicromonosporaceae bacterium]
MTAATTTRRRRRRPDLFAAAAAGERDLFSASIDDVEREAGKVYRQIVAAGGTCQCGAHVASWPWADRIAGVPAPVPRFVPHAKDCPAWIEPEDS